MAKIIPSKVKKEVEEWGFHLLEEWKYLNRTRVENGRFMDQLVDDSKIGKKLLEFLDRAGARKYIKDVIVHDYAKLKRAMPQDIDGVLRSLLLDEIREIDWVPVDRLSLHRSSGGTFVVSARTTYVKWETGLRKVLLYIADKPSLQKEERDVIKCVVIFEHGAPVNSADQRRLQRAMMLIGVHCIWGT